MITINIFKLIVIVVLPGIFVFGLLFPHLLELWDSLNKKTKRITLKILAFVIGIPVAWFVFVYIVNRII